MATLQDTRIVDLKRSVIDEEKSDPENNRYTFIEKRYVGRDTYELDNIFFSWCQYTPTDGYLMFEGWKYDGWEPVLNKEHPYIVEGATLKPDGMWHFKDVVLMKCPFEDEVKRAEERLRLSGSGKKRLEAFAKEVDYMEPSFTKGAGVGPDELMGLRGKR